MATEDKEYKVKVTVDQPKSNVRRAILNGRLDAAGTQAAEQDFNSAVNGGPNLIVDLTHVPFIASMGIRMLVAGAQAQSQAGGKMVFMGPDEMTRRILKTTGLDQLVPVCGDLQEALALY